MCGIVGYIGGQNAVPILIEGLKRLEYRGYDSAGIAFFQGGKINVRRSVGKLRNLEAAISGQRLESNLGIGHTRWATHGRPSEENAHPHRAGKIVVVHNGIIENYIALKEMLIGKGHEFKSETDTEVIAHLIEEYTKKGDDTEKATRKALKELRGAYAIGVVNEDEPDRMIAARAGGPLVIGLGSQEYFIASDLPAILQYTKDAIYLDDHEMAVITTEGVRVTDMKGLPVQKDVTKVLWNPVMAEKGGYKHFMLKEIYEQPRAITDTFRGRISEETGSVFLEEMGITDAALKKIKKVVLVACGTSWHACLIGKFMLEEMARTPSEVDIASEFRYRNPIIDKHTLLVAVTQSGETADTLAAMREAKMLGAKTVAICNVVGSTAARDADGVVYTHAGPEIGVASTKAFTAQLTALYLFALHMAQVRGTLDQKQVRGCITELIKIPVKTEKLLLDVEEGIERVAKTFSKCSDFLYLGRGYNYPVALEGALKLKEISYIHAEGYPAGEMKHGPIALIDENMPVVFLLPTDSVYDKTASNLEEVRSRGGKVIAFVTEGDDKLDRKADHVFHVPATTAPLSPILMAVPLQLLAYHIAVLRGSDVDQPRNLAKSVTVE
ncbi:MAG: glutamine--fructose-6-phosphate transaminase (isomerizing) [Nitrospirae bacterium]|nr:glutamine--fructose-6-phosphate transaminase (isomerizing) [Nitrospirota bacterium]